MADFIKTENLENALYVVATPIGNLEDITLRALNVLKNADVIACEDTRNTSVLLERYKINTKLVSYHKFSESKKSDLFLDFLNEGKSVALVSDAGTPLISDPGEILTDKVINSGYRVIPIAGACAVITLLSSIPRDKEDFKFIGFISRNKNQIIDTVKNNRYENLVFYESPLRLISTLETIADVFPDKKIAIGRELTKKFEEIKIGNISDIIEYYKTNTLKGEIAAMLYADNCTNTVDISDKIAKLKSLGLKDKEIAKILSSLYEINKNDIYKMCIDKTL